MALGSLSLCQPGCVPLTAHCSLQWRFSSRALPEHISHLSPLTVTWASLGGHWVDSFQPKRKTNCSNSHNELHWLPRPQFKCLDWSQMDVTPSGPEPQHHSLDVQPHCPTAALQPGTVLSLHHHSGPVPLCGEWELGHLGMPIQAIQDSKAGCEAGTSFIVGSSKLHLLWSSPTKEHAVEVAACNAPWCSSHSPEEEEINPHGPRKGIPALSWGWQEAKSPLWRQILQAEQREALQPSKQYWASGVWASQSTLQCS